MADKNIYLTFSNGIKVPQIGLGTYKVGEINILIYPQCSMHWRICTQSCVDGESPQLVLLLPT